MGPKTSDNDFSREKTKSIMLSFEGGKTTKINIQLTRKVNIHNCLFIYILMILVK